MSKMISPTKPHTGPAITVSIGEKHRAVVNIDVKKDLTDDDKLRLLKVIRAEILLLLKPQKEFPNISVPVNRTTIWQHNICLTKPDVCGGVQYE